MSIDDFIGSRPRRIGHALRHMHIGPFCGHLAQNAAMTAYCDEAYSVLRTVNGRSIRHLRNEANHLQVPGEGEAL